MYLCWVYFMLCYLFVLIYCFLNVALSISDYMYRVKRWADRWVMYWKGFVRKRLSLSCTLCSGISNEGLRKTTKIFDQLNDGSADIPTDWVKSFGDYFNTIQHLPEQIEETEENSVSWVWNVKSKSPKYKAGMLISKLRRFVARRFVTRPEYSSGLLSKAF